MIQPVLSNESEQKQRRSRHGLP